ncbi:hypothetical protein [Priestia aryabhattai]|uniref:hypothetical protein n=1 Tax=Priestia aryabhattai TaxID=412384 RepID=UPI002E1E6C02|nr:hypothetical protein [Priestia aryabhattai]
MDKYYSYYNPKDGKHYVEKSYPQRKKNKRNFTRDQDRNVDHQINTNYLNQEPPYYYARVCVYKTPDSNVTAERVYQDVYITTDKIWNRYCNLLFVARNSLSNIEVVNPRFNNIRSELVGGTGFSQLSQRAQDFLRINCYDRSISIFYVGGETLPGGAIGRAYPIPNASAPGGFNLAIVLADGANTEALSHELGHSLMTRNIPGFGIMAVDPSKTPNSPDRGHTNEEGNIMNPILQEGKDYHVNSAQCQKVKESPYVLIPPGVPANQTF